MKISKQILLNRMKRLFDKHGLDWEVLFQNAREIIVFGSSTISVKSTGDLDVLIIGASKRIKTDDLDVVSKPISALTNRNWLGSELANHIAKYGIWLKGNGEWAKNVYVSQKAINFKRILIKCRAQSLSKSWPNLNEPYRIKHIIKLRRDLQRLQYLSKSTPVPPSPVLDRQWRKILKLHPPELGCAPIFKNSRLLKKNQIKLFAPC